MKERTFVAKTGSGQTVEVMAKNTETELLTTYPIAYLPTPDGHRFGITLTHEQCRDLLGFILSEMQKYGVVLLEDQEGWESFKYECVRERREMEEQKLDEMFPGLSTLKAIRSAENRYHEDFEKALENENTVNFPVKPKKSFEQEAKKYPAAVAYLKAEYYATSSNGGQYDAGTKALERLMNGEDFKQVIDEMEAEWHAYTAKHIWD